MLKLFKSPWLRLFLVPYVLLTILIFSYGTYTKTIPVSFFDEVLWVGRSYFFQFYIHGDFKNRIWQSFTSYDQPKLAEYAFGAWLYPRYLNEISKNPKPFDYTRFLIKNGFYFIDENYMDTYADYKETSNIVKFDHRDSGFPAEYVAKYGTDSLKPINLINYARILNIFLLAGAAIFAYFFLLQYAGVVVAIIFAFFYGFNSLIINTGLPAHSEALFLFTFNGAFLFMNLYFTKGRKIVYLLLFSLFTGLCISTKLNGSMLLVIFFVSNILLSLLSLLSIKKIVTHVLYSILPVLISIIILVSLNPFTFPNPVKNVQYLFDWRIKTAFIYQAKGYPESFLPNGISRVKKIFVHFYSSEQRTYFNGVKIFNEAPVLKNYEGSLIVLFVLGFLLIVKQAYNKNTAAIVFICSLVTILAFMSYYLALDWDRYYAHLPLFFITAQSLGLCLVVKNSFIYIYKVARGVGNKITRTKNKQDNDLAR